MSNPIHIDTLVDSGYGVSGVAISANSRYLYIANRIYVHQFDLWAKDILSTKVRVDNYNGETNAWGQETYLYKMQLAPDRKIYLAGSNVVQALHVINYPDSAGINCKIKMSAVKLPTNFYRGLPNMPNYNLGPKIGSPCENLSATTEQVSIANAKVYPNPTDAVVTIESTAAKMKSINVRDITGGHIVVPLDIIDDNKFQIDFSSSTNGIYFLNIKFEDGSSITQKINIIH